MKKIIIYSIIPCLFLALVKNTFAFSSSFSVNSKNEPVEQLTLTQADISTIKSLNMNAILNTSGCGSTDHFSLAFTLGTTSDVTTISPNGYNAYNSYDPNVIIGESLQEEGIDELDHPVNHSLQPGSYTYTVSAQSGTWADFLSNFDRAELAIDVFNSDNSCDFLYIFTPIFQFSNLPYNFLN